LFMTYATSRRIRGRTQGCAPSRFLREVPQELVHQIQGNIFTTPRNTMFASQDSSPFAHYKPGILVSHKIFGEGTVIEMSGQGDYTQIMVEFEKHGTKILAAKFAKLDIV